MTVTIVDAVVVAVAVAVAVPVAVPCAVPFVVSVVVFVFVSVAVVGIVGRTGGVMPAFVPWEGATKNRRLRASAFCLS